MAGSYHHCVHKDGTFWEDNALIENLGDAHEACEMMVFMIQWMSQRAFFTDAQSPARRIQEAENAYYRYARKEDEPWPGVPYDKDA